MPFNKKLIYFLSLVLFLSFFSTDYCFADTYVWKDFTKPFILDNYKLASANPLTINVYIPTEVLKKSAKIPLIFKGSTGVLDGRKVTLKINDNFWAFHVFPDEIPAIYTINIKTKHLKPGPNKLRFTKERNGFLFIHSLQSQFQNVIVNTIPAR